MAQPEHYDSRQDGAPPRDYQRGGGDYGGGGDRGYAGDSRASGYRDDGGYGGSSRGDGATPEDHKIYVGNINYKMTQRDLEDEFGRYGRVTDVHLPMERDTGRPRGFAFVTFADPRDADEALDMDGREVDGRKIRVTKAESRKRRPFGGAPPAGGSGGAEAPPPSSSSSSS
eukprot:CAMPEP_0185690130 /NCGR_PEP_ID=MMETSP1164-20130828/928_1 /TAXON_ID=1104430 /ORGANISM="Chrysoreinhardia sp, Strain CCMP2950" /LENGTH=170 /DNA_ID=CAMNT_0028356685 /DNA_START=955 /DNA_END=1463 /DNA_ORIENTATION=+